ncbi:MULTISPECIES: VWA domain-containing protein [Dictyoglomus]|jgi:Mg-chelatase subunit ChlD|uniref:VWA domain-containing protein n=1 Tax=Dictyoglomus TaxID=13 RepID=UPI000CCF3685|nr:VWA domain-containing protein [Dictyoglomus turgidum]PNV79448.1 MAG: VWA domain-containing protein [Dictyoglomus turgidum]
MISFEKPIFLVLIPIIYFLIKRYKKKAILRSIEILLILFSLSGLQIMSYSDRVNTFFLLDQSASIPSWEKERAIGFIKESLNSKKSYDRVGLVSFAGDVNVEQDLSENTDLSNLSGIKNPYFTNIEEALNRILLIKPQEKPARVIIFSDLQENAGRVLNLEDRIKREKIQIDIFPLNTAFHKEISIEKIQNSDIGHLGQEFPISIRIKSYGIKEAKLKINFDGTSQIQDLKDLQEDNIISLSLKAKNTGLKEIEAEIYSPEDTYKENNMASSYIYIQGKPKILYLAGKDFNPTFAKSLVIQGWDVVIDFKPYSQISNLNSYQGVIMDNIPQEDLPLDKMELLKNFVIDKGGTLLILGGDKSFSAGNYHGTPLEEILPLTLKPEQILKKSNVAIIIVLDASGSMGSYSGGDMKMELAKESAQLVLDLLEDKDYFGLIAFDHSYQWIVPLQPLTNKEEAASLISRISPGGGTALYPPLKSAGESLLKVPIKSKHIIAITDGQTEGGDFYNLVRNLAKYKITVSTIGIGEDANIPLLKDIANWGNGRFYHTWNIRNLPQLLLSETKALLRSNIVEKSFIPKSLADEKIEFPPLKGYVLTSSRYPYPTILSSPEGDPILAKGQFGLGQVIAFTSALKNYWGDEWLKWNKLGKFFSEMLREAIPHQVSEIQISIREEEGKGILNIVYADKDGNYINFANLKYTLTDIQGREIKGSFYQKAPGTYEAIFPIEKLGKYQITIQDNDKILAKIPWSFGNSKEFIPKTFNKELAQKITSISSGKIISSPSDVFRRMPYWDADKKDLSTPLLISCVILFLVELISRRWKEIQELILNLLGKIKIVEDQEWYKKVESKMIEEFNKKPTPSMLETVTLELRARMFIAHLKEEERKRKEKK